MTPAGGVVAFRATSTGVPAYIHFLVDQAACVYKAVARLLDLFFVDLQPHAELVSLSVTASSDCIATPALRPALKPFLSGSMMLLGEADLEKVFRRVSVKFEDIAPAVHARGRVSHGIDFTSVRRR